ncbi:hypothetical protein [Paenibacillus dendritiformis]|uniref:hypothetical protein n=1 Tax=Paenibacillus dendritiformis TaxID=130049 RepID=UPI00387E1BD6
MEAPPLNYWSTDSLSLLYCMNAPWDAHGRVQTDVSPNYGFSLTGVVWQTCPAVSRHVRQGN